ncbi:MAG: hypothetical protein J5493_00320 [Lachnospiraceae bacterium]|nr:hypothetical protein [Lachnospiraceae bacterium]
MTFSDKLNGFWEEGYHYYIEIRDSRLTLRRYDRLITLETEIAYDAATLERGERTVITLEDPVLSRTYTGDFMSRIDELAYEDGKLFLLRNYLDQEKVPYTLNKVDHGPFDHIRIRDDEFMDALQGEWVRWTSKGPGDVLTIEGRTLSWGILGGGRFHAVSYQYAPDEVHLVPEDLVSSNFSGFTAVTVEKDMLTTRMIVFDASVPLSVFVRRDMLDKVRIPDAAKQPMVSTMTCQPQTPLPGMIPNPEPLIPIGTVPKPAEKPAPFPLPHDDPAERARICACCGQIFEQDPPKFCPECGAPL